MIFIDFDRYFGKFFRFGKYGRYSIYTIVILIIFIGLNLYRTFSGDIQVSDEISKEDVKKEIMVIDQAISLFYKEQFSLPEDIEHLLDFDYLEENKDIRRDWEFSFEGDSNYITGIKAVSTNPRSKGETIRFNCIDKTFD